MSFPFSTVFGRILTLAGIAGLLAGCGGGSSPAAPSVAPQTNLYGVAQTITWTGVPPAAPAVFSFDISFVDPTAHQLYIGDRTTNGVTVIDTQALKYVMTAGQGMFAGFKPNNPDGSPPNNAGPNGVVPIGNGLVMAGDGDSTLKVVNITTGALVATIPAVNPYVGAALPATCGGAGTPTGTPLATNQRVDEMAYDPTDGLVLAINDAACPPFGTFFSTTAPFAARGSIAFQNANGGAEQPTWDPTQNKFIQPFPSTIANAGGEVDLIDPHTFAITAQFPVTNCQPNGTALGPNETLFLGCSSKALPQQLLTINATNGATLNSISGVGGADEVWYNPTANRFYAAASNNASGPVVVVADGTGKLITTAATSTGAHSVAVDPTSDHIFIPGQKLGVSVYTH
jgi:hypothetical protein